MFLSKTINRGKLNLPLIFWEGKLHFLDLFVILKLFEALFSLMLNVHNVTPLYPLYLNLSKLFISSPHQQRQHCGATPCKEGEEVDAAVRRREEEVEAEEQDGGAFRACAVVVPRCHCLLLIS